MIYNLEDIVSTKKKHVCGSNQWKILRLGIEIKLKCVKCDREIMMLKSELDKKIIKVEKIEKQ